MQQTDKSGETCTYCHRSLMARFVSGVDVAKPSLKMQPLHCCTNLRKKWTAPDETGQKYTKPGFATGSAAHVAAALTSHNCCLFLLFGHIMSPHHSDQMSQRSQVSRFSL